MEFGSQYGYNYGFNGSDLESLSDDDDEQHQNAQIEFIKSKKKKKTRKSDTNILTISLEKLINPAIKNEQTSNDLIQCQNCGAALTFISLEKIHVENDGKTVWSCEFCSFKNDLTTKNYEPNKLNQHGNTYTLGPTLNAESNTSDGYITICIDLSDSMRTRIQSNDLAQVSRLDGVKMACVDALRLLKKESPRKKAALITFADSVRFYGDSTKLANNSPLIDTIKFVDTDNLIVYENKLSLCERLTRCFNLMRRNRKEYNFDSIFDDKTRKTADIHFDTERLLKLAQEQNGELLSVGETFEKMSHLIRSLKTQSFTALGPSLAFAIGFSSKKPNSEVILCTDGCGNVGVGNEVDLNRANIFYRMLADYAKEKNIRINVLSIHGEDCKLALLCKLVDRTNGTMSIVNPSKISDELKLMLDGGVIATEVSVRVFVEKGFMYVRDDEVEREEEKLIKSENVSRRYLLNEFKKSVVSKELGSVDGETELVFEYGMRMRKIDDGVNECRGKMPFQVQVKYKGLDGSERIRIMSKWQVFVEDRKLAEANLVSSDLIWSNGLKRISEDLILENVGLAKQREKSMKKFALNNNLQVPLGFSRNSELVKKISSGKKVFELSDKETMQIFRAKNKSLKFLNEKETVN